MTDQVEITYTGPLPRGVQALPEGRSVEFTRGVPVTVAKSDADALDGEVWKSKKSKAAPAVSKADEADKKEA